MFICFYLYIPFIYLEFSYLQIFNILIKEIFLFLYCNYSDFIRYIFMYFDIFLQLFRKERYTRVFHVSSLNLFIRCVQRSYIRRLARLGLIGFNLRLSTYRRPSTICNKRT